MIEGSAAAAVSAIGALVIMSFWRARRQDQPTQRPQYEPLEPHVRVVGAEFIQVPRVTPTGSFFEPSMDFRASLANRGPGSAFQVRGRVAKDGKYYWGTSDPIELEGLGGQCEVVLHSLILPRLEPDRFTWVEMPLRLDYLDERGGEWFTQVPLRLKVMRHAAADACSCWWVDVLDPEQHGRIA